MEDEGRGADGGEVDEGNEGVEDEGRGVDGGEVDEGMGEV